MKHKCQEGVYSTSLLLRNANESKVLIPVTELVVVFFLTSLEDMFIDFGERGWKGERKEDTH